MTDQFLPEYIAHILSDEAKGLQKVDLNPGDWVWTGHEIGIVLRQWAGFETGPLAHLTVLRLSKHGWSEESFSRTQLTKLLTLHQLLQIIEGAGYTWERTPNGDWRIFNATERRSWLAFDLHDDMLAAAKLAVRALEEE